MQRACSRSRTISAVTPQSLVSCKIAEKCGRNIWSLVMQDRAAHAHLQPWSRIALHHPNMQATTGAEGIIELGVVHMERWSDD